jgi:hypothetical protein
MHWAFRDATRQIAIDTVASDGVSWRQPSTNYDAVCIFGIGNHVVGAYGIVIGSI